MPREKGTETLTPRRTSLDIVLNRASLGDAEHVFAVIQSIEGVPNYPTYVPRKDVRIKKQPLRGNTLAATLEVDIVGEDSRSYFVETEREGGTKVRLKVNKEQGRIEPLGNRAILGEDVPVR